MAYIEMKHSFKRYQVGDTEIVANHDISFEIEKGELVIILGASGAGKSTVLNILGGMDTNDEGDILIDGQNIADYNSHQLTDYRRNDVGFVFQFYNLVPKLTANGLQYRQASAANLTGHVSQSRSDSYYRDPQCCLGSHC